jgi:tetratricopeptide (TPR) repeat protein
MILGDRESRPGMARALALLVLLVGFGSAAGCASRSPAQQAFVEVRTRSFRLTSSLSAEDTLEFARRLEFFHAGVLSLLGLEDAATPEIPTQVLVFDDRSPARPFAVEHEAAYLLDEVAAPILVFRGARDFSARATPELRHRYAHRVLRDHAGAELPLWYEEGSAQLARTIEDLDAGVRVGRRDAAFQGRVLDWRREDLLSVLQTSDLSGMTRVQREAFEAEVWAIAHTLEFSQPSPGRGSLLSAYREALAVREASAQENAFAAIGLSKAALAERVIRHLESRRSTVRILEPRGWDPRRIAVVPLSRAESRARLGELALAIGRPALAADHFELALAADPELQRARIGGARAAAEGGEGVAADAFFDALALSEDAPAELRVAAGDAARALATTTADPELRSRALAFARERYASALAGDESAASAASIGARMGLALCHLEVEGESPAEIVEWLEAVRAARPGSLVLELRLAEAEAATGASRAAAIRARNVVSRNHALALDHAARALLDRLEGAAAR